MPDTHWIHSSLPCERPMLRKLQNCSVDSVQTRRASSRMECLRMLGWYQESAMICAFQNMFICQWFVPIGILHCIFFPCSSDWSIALILPLYVATCFVSFHDVLFPFHSLLLSKMTQTDWNYGCTKYAKQKLIGPINKLMFAQPSNCVFEVSLATSEEGLRTPAVIEYFETLGHLSNSTSR